MVALGLKTAAAPAMHMAQLTARTTVPFSCRAQHTAREQQVNRTAKHTLPILSTATLVSSQVLPALAEDLSAQAAPAQAGIFGFTPLGVAIGLGPAFVYSLFYLYREKVNPRAKIGDLLFVVAACLIGFNIFSILVFKQRIF